MRRAVAMLLDRHDALRTVVVALSSGELLQRVEVLLSSGQRESFHTTVVHVSAVSQVGRLFDLIPGSLVTLFDFINILTKLV